jgi:hypothetical protein
MSRSGRLATSFATVALGLLALAAACGGTTATGPGIVDTGDAAGSDAAEAGSDAPMCVFVQLMAGDTACSGDPDCTLTSVGKICTGSCGCGSTPANMAAATRIGAATAGLQLEACPCAFPGNPRCVMGVCILCGFGPGQPAGCPDGG